MTPARSDEPNRRALGTPTVARPASAAGGVLVAAGVVALLYLVRAILLPFVLAAIVAFVCSPLIDRLACSVRWRRSLIATAVLLALMAIAAGLGLLVIPVAKQQLLAVVADPGHSIARFARALIGNHSYQFAGVSVDASELAARASRGLAATVADGGRLLTVAAWSVAELFKFILTWVLLAYLLFDGPGVMQGLLWVVPPRHRAFAQQLWQQAAPILRRYFIGVALVVVYASAAAYIGLGFVLGLQHALFLALVTGFLELVPLVGPVSSAVLAGLVAVREATSAASIVAYIGYAIALRLSIDQLFGPIVLGRAAYMRPVLVILCFLVGGILLGIVGIVIAVPVALTLKVALKIRYEQMPSIGDVRHVISS
jgi:predicted PurR-regulated permease PerM